MGDRPLDQTSGRTASFGYWVRRRRLALDLTQSGLAHRVACSAATIKKIEHDQRRPSRQMAARLAESLEIPIDQRPAFIAMGRGDRPPDRQPVDVAPVVESVPPEQSGLPASSTPFFGRQAEIEDLVGLLQNDAVRLVTITGTGGIGKTRLALEVASRLAHKTADGVAFVDLAPIRDPNLVVATISAVLDIKEQGDQSPIETLIHHLANRRLILLLDNFEHLIDAAQVVSQLLAAAPTLKVLTTSRERLRLRGEHDVPLAPLPVPATNTTDVTSLRQIDTVRLFEDRAHAVDHSFFLSGDNAEDVAHICRRLEGLPLAIELAAARINIFPPNLLLQRLETRIGALTGGPRDAPERQKTLRSTLEWSYGLLNAEERRLFNRLSIFQGGWALDQAQSVCQPGLGIDIFEGLASLLDKSLITRDHAARPRYGMLETLREYALENLASSAEIDSVALRHAQAYAALAEDSPPNMEGAESRAWTARVEAEHDNLRAALVWTEFGSHHLALSLRLVGALSSFWVLRGHLSEGYASTSRVLSHIKSDEDPRLLATAMLGAARLAYRQNNVADSERLYSAGLDLARQSQDLALIADALEGLGAAATEVGEFDLAARRFLESREAYRKLGRDIGIADADMMLGWVALKTADDETAEEHFVQAVDRAEDAESQIVVAFSLSGLGETFLRQGRLVEAMSTLERSLDIREALGDKWGIAVVLGSLGWAHLLQSEADQAVELLRRSLRLRREIGDKGGTAWCLEKLAEVAADADDDRQAVRLFAAADSLRAGVGSIIDPVDQPARDERLAALRQRLGDSMFEGLWEEGAATPWRDMVDRLLRT
jgi:predicted ATPase/transcriptional regulator with XRE-family HTH domain